MLTLSPAFGGSFRECDRPVMRVGADWCVSRTLSLTRQRLRLARAGSVLA
jgi:hypothetical protein